MVTEGQPEDQAPSSYDDPDVLRVAYALRALGVRGQAVSLDVLGDVGGADLTPPQMATVLQLISDPLAPQWDPEWDSQWVWNRQRENWYPQRRQDREPAG